MHICGFGTYEKGFLLQETVQTDDARGDVRSCSSQDALSNENGIGCVRSFGSQDILSNGNGMRYLQKKRKQEEGTDGI